VLWLRRPRISGEDLQKSYRYLYPPKTPEAPVVAAEVGHRRQYLLYLLAPLSRVPASSQGLSPVSTV